MEIPRHKVWQLKGDWLNRLVWLIRNACHDHWCQLFHSDKSLLFLSFKQSSNFIFSSLFPTLEVIAFQLFWLYWSKVFPISALFKHVRKDFKADYQLPICTKQHAAKTYQRWHDAKWEITCQWKFHWSNYLGISWKIQMFRKKDRNVKQQVGCRAFGSCKVLWLGFSQKVKQMLVGSKQPVRTKHGSGKATIRKNAKN